MCLLLCLFVGLHILKTAQPNLSKFCLYGRRSVLLWRRYDTLCTSGFTDSHVLCNFDYFIFLCVCIFPFFVRVFLVLGIWLPGYVLNLCLVLRLSMTHDGTLMNFRFCG